MEIEKIEVEGKIGKLNFSHCPNCKKYIVFSSLKTVKCSNCRKKYEIEYGEA